MKSNTSTFQTDRLLSSLVFLAVLLAACSSKLRVGEVRTESQSVELGDAQSVRVEINLGSGDLEVTGGADKLFEADFTYNVAKLKPEVKYKDGTLVLSQPENEGLPDLRGITDFRNEWALRLNDRVPLDLRVDIGAGASELRLAGLSLTGLDLTLGAGGSMIDLSGDWAHHLNVTMNAGAGDITVRLPKDMGVRVAVDAGVGTIEALGLNQDGNIYTNSAYGEADVTMQVDIDAGLGQINLELAD